MFDVLDRQTKLTGNQKKIIAAATGMGSAYGFGGIGKIIGPAGLAVIVGSSNYLKPDVPLPQFPIAFLYLGCWFLMAGVVYYFFGLETKGKSMEQIDRELATA